MCFDALGFRKENAQYNSALVEAQRQILGIILNQIHVVLHQLTLSSAAKCTSF